MTLTGFKAGETVRVFDAAGRLTLSEKLILMEP